MGRSVNYLDNAEVIIYFNFENDDIDGDSFQWDCLMDSLTEAIQKKLPSYYKVDEWDNRETRIFLQNDLCNIGVSEYCGLVSLSVAPRNSDNLDSFSTFRDNFAIIHANKIHNTLNKIVDNCTGNRLVRQGTFSNGMGVFESAKDKKAIYENAGRII